MRRATAQGGAQHQVHTRCGAHLHPTSFNLLSGRMQHELDFADLKLRFGLDQGELESQAQVLVEQTAKKRLTKAAKKAELDKAK